MNAFSPKVTTRNSTCEGSRTGNTCGPSGAEAAPARLRGAGGGGERREAAPHLQQSAGGGQPGGLAEHVPRGHPLPARPGPALPRRQEMAVAPPPSRRDLVSAAGTAPACGRKAGTGRDTRAEAGGAVCSSRGP